MKFYGDDHYIKQIFPIFIMKNEIWYQCSPESDMMLVSCEEILK